MEVQKYNLRFNGNECSVWIKPLKGERYQLLIKTQKKLTNEEQQKFLQYLEAEGYIQNDVAFE